MLTKKIRDQLYAASQLTFEIKKNKEEHKYKNLQNYKDAKFTGTVQTYIAGKGDKDLGLFGIANIEGRDGIIVAYRGTNGVIDLLNDFDITRVDSPFSNKGGEKLHHGFLSSFNNLEKKGMFKALSALINENPNCDVYLTGHSKGGALATIVGLWYRDTYPQKLTKLKTVTFGSPRVGNLALSKNYTINHYRYESFLDIVPHLCFSHQENEMFKRNIKIYGLLEMFFGIFLENTEIIAEYASVGKRLAFKYEGSGKKDKRHEFLCLPIETDNPSGETLNSFVAAMNLIVSTKNPIFVNNLHVEDYKHIPDNLL